MVLLSLPLNLLHCTTACAASLSKLNVTNRDLNPVLAEQGVVASEKSRSNSTFAFSCSRSPVTGMSFSRAARGGVQSFR